MAILAAAGCGSPGQSPLGIEATAPRAQPPLAEFTESSAKVRTTESPQETPKDAAVEVAATEELSTTPGGLLPKTFDDIKFDIEPDAPFDRSMLTESINELNGKRIRIRGWILPTPRSRGIKQFVLVRDNQECCFGPGAALYDCILVEMQPGKTAEFSYQSVAVEGEFTVNEFPGPGGRLLAIYHLVGESVTR